MAHQKTFYQISRVVITDIRYGIVNSSDFSHCEVVVGSQKWRSSKQEEENGAANSPQVWTVIAIREEGEVGRVRNLPSWIYFVFGEYLW
jgi:hypothetical protein